MKRPLIFATLLYIVALFMLSPKNTLSFICERHINPPGYAEWCYFTAAILLNGSIVVFGILALRTLYLHIQQQGNAEERPKRTGFIKAPWQKEKKSPVEPEKKSSVSLLITVFLVAQAISLCGDFRKHHFPDFVRQGYYQLADLCLLLGADPDAEDRLYLYCCNRSADESKKLETLRRITYLLKSGANPNRTYANGRTPVDECLYTKNKHLLSLMFAYGGKAEWNLYSQLPPPACFAAEEADPDLLRQLMQHGADIHTPNPWGQDKTPLHYAVARRYAHDELQLQCVRILLEAGADVNALTRDGMTAADICSDEGPICDLLRQHGALRARELPLSLNGDTSDLTAVLKAANPEMKDMDAQGLLDLKSYTIVYSYSHTGKGNAFITVRGEKGSLSIRCCDAHDDGSFYRDSWAQICLEDSNGDSYRDLIVEYTECTGEEDEGTRMREVYLYYPDGHYFKLLCKGPRP